MTRVRRIHLQSEAAECGLACLAMLADHHGLRVELRDLRRRFAVSLKGSTLAQVMRHATMLGFAPRALRCEPGDLARLKLPCVAHWNLNHFVVVERVGPRDASIVDPATGRRRVAADEVSRAFSGIALELTPTPGFVAEDTRRRLSWSTLAGRVTGLKRALAHLVVLAAALEVVALATPVVTQFVVDDALVSGDRDLLALCVLGGAALVAIEFALRIARGWIATRVNQELALQWTANLFTHLLRLPLAFFERRHLGDITSRFASLATIRSTLTTGTVTAVIDGALALATLGLMVVYSARLALVAAAAMGLYAGLRTLAYPTLRRATEERLVFSARETSYFLESIRAVLALRLHGRTGERIARWQNLMVDVQNRETVTQRLTLAFASVSACLAGLEGLLLLFLGGGAVLDRTMSLGMLLAFLAYRTQFGERVARLVDVAVDLRMLGLHANRLADIALEPPDADAPVEIDVARLVPRIDVRGISFRYGDGEPWILRDLSLVVEAGESIAIVGASGCGKSTLVKLMLGLYAPAEGEVRVGSHDRSWSIRRLGAASHRGLVGTVMQDDALLAGSLAENIACFDPQPDAHAIEEAARLACIHDDIVAMPMGYQSLIGDLGASLSGGQKQRVLLARALYDRPRILVLDEATSHLDVDHERRVNAAIRSLPLTRITIAHRPETIAAADRVVVLECGRIVRDVRRTTVGTRDNDVIPAKAGTQSSSGTN